MLDLKSVYKQKVAIKIDNLEEFSLVVDEIYEQFGNSAFALGKWNDSKMKLYLSQYPTDIAVSINSSWLSYCDRAWYTAHGFSIVDVDSLDDNSLDISLNEDDIKYLFDI